MGTLVLVRHGQASFLAENYDRLSELGELQSRLLGQHWARSGVTFDRVFSGPLERQRRTAELCGEGYRAAGGEWPGHQVLDGLDEMRAETVFRRALPDLAARHPAIAAELAQFHSATGRAQAGRHLQHLFSTVVAMWVRGELDGGDVEPWPAFTARVRQALAVLRAGEGKARRIAAITSGGPISVAMQAALGTGNEATLELAWVIRNAALSEFLFSGDRFTLHTFNALPHLEPALWTHR
jgi:broad specificity phosphatase PhoE